MKRVFELVNKNLFFSHLSDFFERPPATDSHPPLITISREYGSGGSIIARQVARKLGKPWKVYHEEIIDEIAKQTHLRRDLIKEVDESKLPLIETVISEFFGNRYVNLNTYAKQLIKVLSTIGNRGYAVIVGRGANFLFPDSLKIRIVGETNYRIKVIMKYRKADEKRAKELIETLDKKRLEFIRTAFGHDPKKAHHYNLVIRTSDNIPIEDATDLIVLLAKRRFKLK